MLGLGILLLLALLLVVLILSGMIAWEAAHPPRRSVGYAVARNMPTDPEECDLAFENWQIDLPDGVSLPVWEIDLSGENCQSTQPLTVVLLHGWGQSRIDALARIDPWRSATTVGRIVLYDLRGHGDGTGRSRLGYGEENDLLALLERLGDGPVILAGHSMGAEIALFAAVADHPQAKRIVGVVATGPYRKAHVPLRNRMKELRMPGRPITDLALLFLRLAGVRQRDALEQATKLTCPLLVIHGELDIIAPPEHGQTITNAAHRNRYVEIADIGHHRLHLADPQKYQDAIHQFVESLSPTAANQSTAKVGM